MLQGPDSESMMMDPAVKTALAFCVLLTGFGAAMLLRSDKPNGRRPSLPLRNNS